MERDVLGVALGSANPVKRRVCETALTELAVAFRIHCLAVDPGVPEQPRSDEEALRGAEARAGAAREAADASVGVGIESGVASVGPRLYAFTWVAVCDVGGTFSRACSSRVELPDAIAQELRRGATLEAAVERVWGVPRAGRGEGAMGLLSGGRVTRFDAMLQAARFALAPLESRRERAPG